MAIIEVGLWKPIEPKLESWVLLHFSDNIQCRQERTTCAIHFQNNPWQGQASPLYQWCYYVAVDKKGPHRGVSEICRE